jgi:lipid-A-disaccharide synthase-like uncharacterized protein
LLFGARWLIQVAASRRPKSPLLARLVWYMSLLGSLLMVAYFLFSQKQDPVGVLQNLLPAFAAAYGLWLEVRHYRWDHNRQLHLTELSPRSAGYLWAELEAFVRLHRAELVPRDPSSRVLLSDKRAPAPLTERAHITLEPALLPEEGS